MNPIEEQIQRLVAIQDVEGQIEQAGREIVAMGQTGLALDQELAEREAQLIADQTALDDLKKNYRQLESESADNSQMVIKSKAKLPRVKTNKEYQSILKEIEDIQNKNSAIEDRMIAQLDRIESVEAAIREKQVQLAAFMDACRRKQERLADNVSKQRQKVAQLGERRADISAEADPKIIVLLEEVKKKVRGSAVVAVQQAICMGCHMNIPAQLFNELQRFDELRFCPHCHRIIYWKATSDESRPE